METFSVLLALCGVNSPVTDGFLYKGPVTGTFNVPFLLAWTNGCKNTHYNDVIMSEIASQITSLTIVYSSVYSGADQSKHQSSASLAFVWGIHRMTSSFWMVIRDHIPVIWRHRNVTDQFICITNHRTASGHQFTRRIRQQPLPDFI